MVPLVFYTMLRRWTTRRSEEKWPHRPLAGDEVRTHLFLYPVSTEVFRRGL